jgi:TonB family protein
MVRVEGAQVGSDWLASLHEWWDRHSYYPEEAAVAGEDGTVQVHLVVDRDGHVRSVELETRSGSKWLDLGSLAVFRGAQLPPFPLSTPEPRADLHITIQYVLLRR